MYMVRHNFHLFDIKIIIFGNTQEHLFNVFRQLIN